VQLGPVLPPPPGSQNRPPGGQSPSAGAQTPVPFVGVNQPYGDGNTVFVVHGQGWPVGARITVTLLGKGASPIQPTVDRAGTFSYAINQDHEFFRGGLPVGTYTVRVTDAHGDAAEASFLVQRE